MPGEERARVCEFGPFRYDPAQRLLFRGGEVVALAPKAIDTLHVLIERRGQVVEKAELMRLVWPDCTVEEVGLARNISLLRKALGDEREQFISTIPKRGYRFAAPVVEVAEVAPASEPAPVRELAGAAEVVNAARVSSAAPAASGAAVAPPERAPWTGHEREEPAALRRSRRIRLWLIAAAALALIAGLIDWQFYHPSRYVASGEGFADVAVLPVECLSPELDRAAYCRGFTEVLAGEIAKLDRVHVIAQSTVHRYEQFNIPAPVMARMLLLDATVEGTAQLLGPRLQISLRLKDVNSGKVIWAENYSPPAADLGSAQIDVARAAAGELRARLARRSPASPASR
jgi:DNA-binding winged helix-turn-helix (wHTH) protein/TolB-like protein